jgi:hypothetical protein
VNLRLRLLSAADRALAALVATIVLGASLAFGGAVWWARPALAALIALLVFAALARALFQGSWPVLKSPLTFLGALALLLAVAQVAPLPAQWAGLVSPRSRAIHVLGVLPDRVRADDPSAELPEVGGGRSPATVDRSATLRWLAGAGACLALFGVVGHFADRLGHALVVWGSVVAAFAANTTFALVQLLGQSGGLYGAIEPGRGPAWGPSLADVLATPGASALRPLAEPGRAGMGSGWAVEVPDRPFLIGSLMGGPGAFLALASLGLPLTLGLALHLLAPRGSRERTWARLRANGGAGLVALLYGLVLAGGGVVGLLAGRYLCVPFALGLLLAGLPGARASGLRWTAVVLTLVALAALGAGVAMGDALGRPPGTSPLAARDTWPQARQAWADAAQIARDFPVLGVGLGGFATIYPYYKAHDHALSTAQSSLLQWAVEAGAAGLALLAAAVLWCLVRLPIALRRVGTADRSLAFALVGTAACFALFSAVHWSVELAAVALAACAVAATANRWLAGGTDLFVQHA